MDHLLRNSGGLRPPTFRSGRQVFTIVLKNYRSVELPFSILQRFRGVGGTGLYFSCYESALDYLPKKDNNRDRGDLLDGSGPGTMALLLLVSGGGRSMICFFLSVSPSIISPYHKHT